MLMIEEAKRKQPHLELSHAVRSALRESATNEQMMSVASRLVALTNLLLLRPELQRSATDVGAIVDLPVLKVAAHAPLFQASRPALLMFELGSFLAVLSEESPPTA